MQVMAGRRARFRWVAVAIFSFIALPGCGDDGDDDNPVNPGSSTQITGTFANPTEGGMMAITIASASLAPTTRAGSARAHTAYASATLSPEVGSAVLVTGTYGDESDSLILSGGGYNMAGLYDAASGSIRGSYLGPRGAGRFVGAVGGPSAISIHCGTFEDEDDVSRGRWNLMVSGTTLWGIGALHSGIFYQFEGTVSGGGAMKTISVDDQAVGNGHDLIASGTLDTGTGLGQGTWTSSNSGITINTGPWSVAACYPSGTTQDMSGSYLLGNALGVVTIRIALPVAVPAAAPSLTTQERPATADLLGNPFGFESLAGFFNGETDSLDLVGKPTYAMNGVYESVNNVLTGQLTALGGEGPFITTHGTLTTVKPLCGTFQNESQTLSGPLTLLIQGGAVTGMALPNQGGQLRFYGSAIGTGTTRSMTFSGGDGQGGILEASGTLDTSTYTVTNGTWTIEVNSIPTDSGTWSGELCPGAVP